ncbi:MAG: bactofilin family protein [Thermomicrobiales bacterium]|jgi:cytoskeletal protein CcmA (bactofilin family)|nr:polymer-forming cytoskeletal protein [Thermomicrobiales bacterium]
MATGATIRGGGFTNEMSGEESVIDRSSAFDGVLRTSRNLRIEGQAKGELYCDGTLYVDEGAQVNARVVSANIAVSGTLTGEITCHGKLQIMPTGRVSGRVATASLIIQEGAIYEGELRMSNLDEEPPTTVPSLSVSSTTSDADETDGAPAPNTNHESDSNR